MPETIFSKILRREIPARIVHEDDRCLAFHDINPQAPVHVLVIPKRAIVSVDDLSEEDDALAGHLLRIAGKVARDLGLGEGGYRLVLNNGAAAGQTVFHLHIHVLGGRTLTWPPG